MKLIALTVAALILSGCASLDEKRNFEYINVPAAATVWPTRPDIARYRYVGELWGEQNYTIDKEARSVLQSIVAFFSGESQPRSLQRPQSGYTASDGTIYVTDTSQQSVFVLNITTRKLSVWKHAGEGIQFVSPVAVTAYTGDTILVSDAELGYVVKLDHQGKPLGLIGKGHLTRPTGVAVDPDSKNIYVSDTLEHTVKVFSPVGELLFQIGQRGEERGNFNFPTHLHIANNKLFVTDTMNARIQIMTLDGTFINAIGSRGQYVGDTPRPKGITTDSDGNIYIVESYFDHLLIFNPHGEFLLPIGGSGAGIGEFYLPAGIWSDSHDKIYIADMFNGRVVVLQYLGGE